MDLKQLTWPSTCSRVSDSAREVSALSSSIIVGALHDCLRGCVVEGHLVGCLECHSHFLLRQSCSKRIRKTGKIASHTPVGLVLDDLED
jgi:hypothetical protein